MRVMVFIKAAEVGDAKAPTPEELEAFAAMDRFTEELVEAGVFVAAAGLKNGAEAKRITFDGTELAIIDGPFAEAKNWSPASRFGKSRTWTKPWPGRSARR